MGAVYIGYQKSLKRQVAIKLLPKALAKNELAQQQFRNEAETIAILNHPHIITIYETGEDDEYFYQAMQLVDGEDLSELLQKLRRHPVPTRRRLPVNQTIRIVSEVLEGLEVAHQEGIIHQDLKPANILLENRSGRALIADFGIAKAMQIENAAKGLTVGTPIYLSPEQALAEDTDRRTDIYSMGITLLEMMAGTLPVRKEPAKATLQRKIRAPDSFLLRSPSDCSPLIDERMERIILQAIDAEPSKRFQSCQAFKQALQRWARERDGTVSL